MPEGQGGAAMDHVIVIGPGIGGLTLALTLQRAGVPCRICEAAPEIRPVGGINVLPHAAKEFARIYAEPPGRYAAYEHPRFSIGRGAAGRPRRPRWPLHQREW
jgi:2-polyprenyl-6-methoxyphenol hydroxylase-like FAD-dependent oxidoreductase